MEIKIKKKNQQNYYCEFCDYLTSRKCNMENHLLTRKHFLEKNGKQICLKNKQNYAEKFDDELCSQDLLNDNNLGDDVSHVEKNGKEIKQIKQKQAQTPSNALIFEKKTSTETVSDVYTNSSHICPQCNKNYTSYSGLWKHRKICKEKLEKDEEKEKVIETDINDDINKYKNITSSELVDLIKYIIKENNDFKKEIISSITNINTHNNNNSHNKTFNLNLYLNETCKDAMNIDEFVSSIKVNIEDLEHTGRRGYVEGISNIFIKNLNNIENHLRPLHCSDAKREIFYIKDNNEWIKEKDDKPILTNAIKTIAHENIKQIKAWKELHPGCTLSDSKKNNTYLKILSNSMCGVSDEESLSNIRKIISNISKGSVINKQLIM
jgi:hypothetical protein